MTTAPAAAPTSLLDRYLAHRRRYELAGWLAFLAIDTVANMVTNWLDIRRVRANFQIWEPLVWEASSHLMWLVLLPAFVWLSRRYSLRFKHLRQNLPRHLAATVAISAAHVLGMVALRHLAYAAMGQRYDFGDWPVRFFYEYLKDFRTYFLFIALIYLYRLILLRLQGEASLLAAPDVGAPVESVEQPERLLVRKLGKEFLIAVADIEWLEAAENYVNLHVRSRVYPLRSTMTAIEARLDPAKFIRVHRGYIVNLEHLREIQPLETGDARLLMSNGTLLPCSRRNRPALRARSGVAVAG